MDFVKPFIIGMMIACPIAALILGTAAYDAAHLPPVVAVVSAGVTPQSYAAQQAQADRQLMVAKNAVLLTAIIAATH